MDTITFWGLQVEQPIGEFFIGTLDGNTLYQCSFAEVRNMKESDSEKRIGIQRELNSRRVKEIKQYVEFSDACFPNSVILSVDGDKIINVEPYEHGLYKIELQKDDNTFKIIDGQHRIAGLEDITRKFEMNISLFLDMDVEQQAILFSTINSNQKSVNPSLMVDLSVMQKTRNPIKTAHYIGRVLNEKKDCALFHKISPFATGKTSEGVTITQANFVNHVAIYISGTKQQMYKDRDDLKTGRKLMYASQESAKKLLFRNMFVAEHDSDIAAMILNYYNAVSEKWPLAWKKSEYVLSRTVGFNALFAFMRDVVECIQKYDTVISKYEFLAVLQLLPQKDEDWTVEKYSLNGSGQAEVLKSLRQGLQGQKHQ